MSQFPIRFGPYVLLHHLGSGGMGEVLLASQEIQEMQGVRRLIAVKRLHSHFAGNEQFVRMFLDELRIASRLSNPNIGHILDAGRVGTRIYMTMEYLPGHDLETVLQALESRQELMPLDLAIEIVRRLASALEHAHTRRDESGALLGVVHRDVSPDNVILTVHGEIKLVDFGIAKARDRLESTNVGTLKGKITAMAPEQVMGEGMDARTDVFSLGVLFYRLLTGKRPFAGNSYPAKMKQILEHNPPSVLQARDCPTELAELVAKMMTKRPEERVQSAALVLETLDDVLAKERWFVSSRRLAGFLRECAPARVEVFDEASTQAMLEAYSSEDAIPNYEDMESGQREEGAGSAPRWGHPSSLESMTGIGTAIEPARILHSVSMPSYSQYPLMTQVVTVTPVSVPRPDLAEKRKRVSEHVATRLDIARPNQMAVTEPAKRERESTLISDDLPTVYGPPSWNESMDVAKQIKKVETPRKKRRRHRRMALLAIALTLAAFGVLSFLSF